MKTARVVFGLIFTILFYLSAGAAPPDTLFYYPFDGNASDASGSGNHATVFGATLTDDRFGNPNSAYQFDGNDYLRSPFDFEHTFSVGDPYTVSLWFRHSALSGSLNFMFASHLGGSDHLILARPDGTIEVRTYGGSTGVSDSDSLNDGEWHHVVYGVNDSSGFFYVDGVEQADKPTIGVFNRGDTTYIGARTNNNPTDFYEGDIDDILLVEGALTASQIDSLFHVGGWPIAPVVGFNAYYSFSGNAQDESGNGNHLTVNGPQLTTDRFGNPDGAYRFNGTDENLDHVGERIFSQISYSVWMRADTFQTNPPGERRYLISTRTNGPAINHRNKRIGLYVEPDSTASLHFVPSDNSTTSIRVTSIGKLSPGVWHHLVGTWDSNEARLYVDGELDNSIAVGYGPFSFDSNDYMTIGGCGRGNSFAECYGLNLDFFDGDLDDILILDRALSQTEIDSIYHDGGWPIDTTSGGGGEGLVAYWPFDETSGGTAFDATGRGNDGSLVGDVSLGSAGLFGNAASFGSGDGRIAVPKHDDVNFDTQDFAILTWFRTSSTQPGVVFSTRNTSSCSQASGPTVTGSVSGHAVVTVRGNDNVKTSVVGTTTLNDGEWHYFGFTRASNQIFLYIDGVLVDSKTIGNNVDFTTVNDFWIGRSRYCLGEPFQGLMDDFRVYDRALFPSEIDSLFQLGQQQVIFEPLVAWYPLDGNAGDSSGNGNHGSLSGPVPIADRFGNVNAAYHFDGGGDVINMPDDPVFDIQGSLTLMAWVKPDNVAPSQKMGITGKGDSMHRNYDLFIRESGRPYFQINGLTEIDALGNTVLEAGKWYLLTGVYEKDQAIRLYVNGQLDAEVASTGTPSVSGSDFAIGCQGVGRCTNISVPFDGDIDDVRLYNIALNQTQVDSLYKAGCWASGIFPDSSLITEFALDGDGSDATGNGNDLITINNASFTDDRFCDPNAGLEFTGDSSFAMSAAADFLDCQDMGTVAFWFKLNELDPGRTLAAYATNATGASQYSFAISDNGKPALTYKFGGSTSSMEGNSVLKAAHWYHVAFVADGSNAVRLYLNGSEEAVTSILQGGADGSEWFADVNQVLDHDHYFMIGGLIRESGFEQGIDGVMDDVRIYNYPLSQNEIDALSDPVRGLVAYLRFDEVSGSTAFDSTCNDHDGTLMGDVGFAGADGVFGDAVIFGPGDGRIEVTKHDDVNFGTEDFTVLQWLNTTVEREAILFNTRNTSDCSQASGPTVGTRVTSNYAAGAVVRGSDGVKHALFGTTYLTDGAWHQVGLVRDGSQVYLYVDGVAEDSKTIAAGVDFTTTNDLWIGKTRYCTGAPYEGLMDDFRVYDIALSADVIDSLYGAGIPDSLVLFASRDAFIRQGKKSLNEGANPVMQVTDQEPNRALVAFETIPFPLSLVTKATLVLTIDPADPADKWKSGKPIDVHRLLIDWEEGNGRTFGLPEEDQTTGEGLGVTWRCAVDSQIANNQQDCESDWKGADDDIAANTAAGFMITDGLTGEVSWDVTQDLQNGAGFGWLIQKRAKTQTGHVRFYSREGAAAAGSLALAPKLIVDFREQGLPKSMAGGDEENAVPTAYNLSQNYPNPFNPSTSIRYALPENAKVTLTIYNVLGKKVKTLVSGDRAAGYHSVVWDGKNAAGQVVSSGVYVYRLEAGSFVQNRKMVLVK